MPFVSAPQHVGSVDDLLPVARRLIDDAQARHFAAADAVEASCQRGCTACCNQAVPVGRAELRSIDAAIDALDDEMRLRTRTRIRATADHLHGLGFDAEDLYTRPDVAGDYFEASVPCPLLDGDTCVVRNERPLVCRDFLVTSDPVHCEVVPHEQVVNLRIGPDVLTGFADLQAAAREPSSLILALALAEPIPGARPLVEVSTSHAMATLTSARTLGPTG